MRLGGWWRLWIGLSAMWVAGAFAVAFFFMERPTHESLARDVGVVSCNLDFPVPPELAGRVLEIPAQLAQARKLEVNSNEAGEKEFNHAAKGTVEALAAYDGKTVKPLTHAGKSADYFLEVIRDPQGEHHIFVAPTYFSDAQIYDQIDKGLGSLNAWNKFDDLCIEQLKAQRENELYGVRLKEWAVDLGVHVAIGALSFPLLSLLLGAFIGWVWRGFKPRQPH